MLRNSLVVAAVVAPIVIASAVAQQATIKRTPLQTVDFPPGYNVVSAIAEITHSRRFIPSSPSFPPNQDLK